MIISIEFTTFKIESHSTCAFDHLTITDEDGTTLMEKSCGKSLPASITSRTNIVHIFFTSNGIITRPGWSLSWNAVTRG